MLPSRRPRGRSLLPLSAALATTLAAASNATAATWFPTTVMSQTAQSTYPGALAVAPDGSATSVWPDPARRFWITSSDLTPGGAWSTPFALVDPVLRDASDPALVIDANGTATAVYERASASGTLIAETHRPAGGSWSVPTLVNPAMDTGSAPRIAVDPAGNITAAWVSTRADGSHILTSRRAAASGTWSTPVDLAPTTVANRYPRVAVDGAGRATVVWFQQSGASWMPTVARQTDSGAWEPSAVLATDATTDSLPVITTDRSGRTTVAWVAPHGATTAPFTSTAAPGGAWSTQEAAATPPVDVATLAMAGNANGDAALMWTERSSAGRIAGVTRTAEGTWSTREVVSADTDNAFGPTVAVTDDGLAVAAWTAQPVADTNSLVAASTHPPGGRWSAPVANGEPTSPPQHLMLRANADGSTVVAQWDQFDSNNFTHPATAVLDAIGPSLRDLTVPANAAPGAAVSVSVTPTDLWSAVTDTTWSFGDGTTTRGQTANHVYAKAGTYAVTVTSTDSAGNTSEATRRISVAVPGSSGTTSGPGSIPPLRVKGRTATFNVLIQRKRSTAKCPKASALAITLKSARELQITTRRLQLRKSGAGCQLTGTITLRRAVRQGTRVRVTFRHARLAPRTLSTRAQ